MACSPRQTPLRRGPRRAALTSSLWRRAPREPFTTVSIKLSGRADPHVHVDRDEVVDALHHRAGGRRCLRTTHAPIEMQDLGSGILVHILEHGHHLSRFDRTRLSGRPRAEKSIASEPTARGRSATTTSPSSRSRSTRRRTASAHRLFFLPHLTSSPTCVVRAPSGIQVATSNETSALPDVGETEAEYREEHADLEQAWHPELAVQHGPRDTVSMSNRMNTIATR